MSVVKVRTRSSLAQRERTEWGRPHDELTLLGELMRRDSCLIEGMPIRSS
jgi:hypothetical protein